MTEKIIRVPTGVIGFDNLVDGGLKRNSINLVSGGAGSGKTIFAVQFLVTGIIKHKEPGIYITFEEKKEKLYEDMLAFGWDLAALEKQGTFTFLEYTPEQVKKVLIEGGGTVEAIIGKMKAKRLVIDSITSFALLYQEELAKKEASLALFNMISAWGCTAILTSQEETRDGIFISSALEFEVDSLIVLYYARIRGTRSRSLEILKMRGTKHPAKTFPFTIDEKKGIVINVAGKVEF